MTSHSPQLLLNLPLRASNSPDMNQINYHNVLASEDGVFNARSGKLINLFTPIESMICIEDIGSALSKICRFGGHSNGFYSVAQHSVLVATLAPETHRKEALLHDAPEAYLGDVIKPLKNIIGKPYAEIEDRFNDLIIEMYGLDRWKLKEIKQYDTQALEIEHSLLIRGEVVQWLEEMYRLNLNPELWQPDIAYENFTGFFNLYFNA